MALITIKDLQQSTELDRKAMQAIVGGARVGVRPADLSGTTLRSGRIVDYPPGFNRDKPMEANPQRPAG
jgi:hypothetical protein